jgi:protein-disulfide isomerase
MSRKSARNRPTPESRAPQNENPSKASGLSRRAIGIGVVAALLVVLVAGYLLFKAEGTPSAETGDGGNSAALASEHSPALGNPNAKVHIVEFLDPACETCAQFFPLVKRWMADNPDKIRLSVRHVAFHDGSEYVVRALEASRKQDKYWQTLEALLMSQAQWAPDHTAQPDLVLQAISGVGLNVEQLRVDMNAPDVTQRMEQDRSDAMTLKVTATPEYFVNGRPLPSFGEQQLYSLILEELQRAY